MKTKNTLIWVPVLFVAIMLAGTRLAEGQPKPAGGSTAAPATVPAAVAVASGQIPDSCKVAFVNLKKVLDDSKEGQKLKAGLEAEREKAFAPLKAKQAELDKLEEKIIALNQEIATKGQILKPEELYTKRLELQELYSKYQIEYNKLNLEKSKVSDALNDKKNEMLKPLEDKLNAVMEQIGKDGNYCLVMDVSPPAANLPNFNPILYRDPARDITDVVIAAVDKAK